MKLERVRELTPLSRLVYFICERESIRLKKEAGEPKPWTDDPTLQAYRFCNIVRMNDLVSRWLMDNWYKPFYGHPNAVLACVMARQINRIETLEVVGFPEVWQPAEVENKMRAINKNGPVFGAAYMITGSVGKGDKIDQVVNIVMQSISDNAPDIDTGSMERSVEALRSYPGMGQFIAGQVVADLRWAVPGKWSDRYTWAAMGPGSKRGMNRLHGRDKDAPLNQKQFLLELLKLSVQLEDALPKSIYERLELHDVQNCLCEYDKMERILWGQGRPKKLYPGAA